MYKWRAHPGATALMLIAPSKATSYAGAYANLEGWEQAEKREETISPQANPAIQKSL